MSQKPVILQVLPELRSGGVERGTLEIAEAIHKAGWRSLVASEGGPLAHQLRYCGAEHITLPLKSKNPLNIYLNIRRLVEVIRREGVTLVHVRSRAPAWSAYFAAKEAGVPFVTTFHGHYHIQNNLKRRYNSIMTRGDIVIAISEFTKAHILQEYQLTDYKVPEDRIRVIHRGVDLKTFDPAMVNPNTLINLANKWRLPEEHPVIMLPGRMTRWKGQDVLIKALSMLSHRNFFCIIIGDDKGHRHYRAEVEHLVMDLGLGSNVRFVPHTTDMPAALMLSHVVVSASTEPEAFGRVAIEAQAMGRPIIATNHGGSCETVLDGQTGWLVEPGSPISMAKALGEALSLNEEARNAIGREGMAHVREHFSKERMCEKTLAVYRELLEAKEEESALKDAA